MDPKNDPISIPGNVAARHRGERVSFCSLWDCAFRRARAFRLSPVLTQAKFPKSDPGIARLQSPGWKKAPASETCSLFGVGLLVRAGLLEGGELLAGGFDGADAGVGREVDLEAIGVGDLRHE